MVEDDRRLLPHPVTGELFASPVPPGMGWPEDPASPSTPVCMTDEDIASRAAVARTPAELQKFVSVCGACSRLVEWREELAVKKRATFKDQPYWSRPVPSFGNPGSRRVIVGLAPSAHGSNRTGRNFTGDPAGEWLYRALYKAGACSAPRSVATGDGMELRQARIIPPVHCAPPQNKPTSQEKSTCRLWFSRELELIQPHTILALGQVGWDSVFQAGRLLGWNGVSPQPKFGHLARAQAEAQWGLVDVVGCYHPSQRNTATKLLTEEKLDAAVELFLERSLGR